VESKTDKERLFEGVKITYQTWVNRWWVTSYQKALFYSSPIQ